MPLPRFASKGATSFLIHYVRRRIISHSIVLAAVLAAVGCAVGSQYAVKHLVDVLGTQHPAAYKLWGAVFLLLGLVAGDNLLWRLAGWVSTHAFVAVGGDMRLELFDHLSGHGTRYFVERFPGALAGRITAAANAAWTIENALTWTTIPPGTAVIASILVLGTINWHLTVVLLVIVGLLGVSIAWLASHGRHLHQSFAGHAAHVSGD
ncbi:MAG: transporter family protein, partial [Nevskia sp.]|nr:transporter family protein [Nevskia sp.]